MVDPDAFGAEECHLLPLDEHLHLPDSRELRGSVDDLPKLGVHGVHALRVEAEAFTEIHHGRVVLDHDTAQHRGGGNHGNEAEIQLLRGGTFQERCKAVTER